MMENYDWLFQDIDPLSKGIGIRRVNAMDDPSFQRPKPETTEFSKDQGLDIQSEPMGLAEEDLANRANSQLEEAVEHLEVNQNTLNALTTIVEELNKKRLEFEERHPNPLKPKVKELTDPDWATKLSSVFTSAEQRMFGKQQNMIQAILEGRHDKDPKEAAHQIIERIREPKHINKVPIERVGTEPDESIDNGPIQQKVLLEKARQAGMTEEEIVLADQAIDQVFSSIGEKEGGFKKKF